MASRTMDDSLLNQYLLGSLTNEEHLDLEARLLAEDDLFASLEQAESDLIEDAVAGRLGPEEHNCFDRYFLNSPKRREQLEFARALHRVAAEYRASIPETPPEKSATMPHPRPGWRSLFTSPHLGALVTACLMISLSVTIWLLVRESRLRDQLDRERAARMAMEQKYANQHAQTQALANEQIALQDRIDELLDQTGLGQPGTPIVVKAVLSAFQSGIARSGSDVPSQKLVLPANADLVLLRFPAQTDRFAKFEISLLRLKDDERTEIWKKATVPAPRTADQLLLARIPASRLIPGEYAVQLTGITEDNRTEGAGEYRITVTFK